jgi:spermidine/putrescine-binding protein
MERASGETRDGAPERRKKRTARGGVFAAVAAAAACFLVACGSDSGSGSKPAAAGSGTATIVSPKACKNTSLNFIGLAGEEGQKELAAYRKAQNVKLHVTNNPDWGQVTGAIKVGQPYDLNTIPVLEAQKMIKAGAVQPIDTSRLANWKDIVPALRDSPALRGPDGKVYGVPILWGDGPYVYDPGRVTTPPTSIAALLTPAWKGKYTMLDDPGLPFFMLAQSMGFADAPNLTTDEFNQVKAKVKQLVQNASAFSTSYQDATDRMVAGDVDLAINGWEAMVGFAKAKSATLAYSFFKESKGGGYYDGMAIPKTAKNAECALAYIDQLIAPKVNAKLANNLTSGAANGKAIPFLDKQAKQYDYKGVESPTGGIDFVNVYPPETAAAGHASLKDWKDAWASIKAG